MIHGTIYINYLSQFRRCNRADASELIQNLQDITRDFGNTTDAKDDPLRMSFGLDSLFSRIQAAEAIHQWISLMKSKAGDLRGATIIISEGSEDEEAPDRFRLVALSLGMDIDLYFSKAARNILNTYFSFSSSDGLFQRAQYRFANVLSDVGLEQLAYRPASVKAIANYLDAGKAENIRVLFVRVENIHHSAKAMEAIFDNRANSRARRHELACTLYGANTARRALLPFSTCLTGTVIASAKATADKNTLELLDQLEPAFSYMQNTIENTILPQALSAASHSFINLILDHLGGCGQDQTRWLICNNLETFSEAAIEVITKRLQEGRGCERYLVISTQVPPPQWLNLDDKIVNLVSCPEECTENDIEQLVRNRTEPPENLLKSRALAMLGKKAEPNQPAELALLDWLPPEARDFLFAIQLSESSLDKESFDEFIQTAGLRPAGSIFLQRLLVRCGYLDPLVTITFLSPRQSIKPSSSSSEKKLETLYMAFLISQYRKGTIVPSIQLLRRTGENRAEERFMFDCIMNTALRPDNPEEIDTSFLSPSARSLFNFYQASHDGNKKRQSTALVRAGDILDTENKASILALLQAEFAYAEGAVDQLARKAREALLLITRTAPPKLNARIQRMMGLSALTLEKFTDTIDYLTNAAEIAEASGEHYELSQALYTRALAEFINGSIVRSAKSAEQAIKITGVICRPDMAVQQGMLTARIDMELGLYDEAVRRFAALANIALDHGLSAAQLRAEVWQARCLGYAGNTTEARMRLKENQADNEAQVFLAELEVMSGRPEQALVILQSRPEAQPRTYVPPDNFKASSLFQEMEGRCIAFDQDTAILDDMREALFLFSSGLASRNAEYAVQLASLTRTARVAKNNPSLPTYCMYCYLLEEELDQEPVDKQTILSRAFNALQQRAGRIEDRANRALFMDKNIWNRKLIAAAREHKFL